MQPARSIALLLIAVLWTGIAQAALYDELYVFGDSLSDSGNNETAFRQLFGDAYQPTPTPIDDTNTFVPTFPYASGRYTNAAVWAESFAAALGLSSAPSLLGGTNYAFGGARTGPVDPNFPTPTVFPPTLATQAATFLAASGHVAPSNALYVIAGGGNDANDAAQAILGGADPMATIATTSQTYAGEIKGIVDDLQAAGANHIIVWNVPDIGKSPLGLANGPAASAGASFLAQSMNDTLLAGLAGEPGVQVFDVFGLIDAVVADSGAWGLTNVTDACARFTDCDASQYLFWDGIHPTSAGHEILSQQMLVLAVPEPSTYVLLAIGLALLVMVRRRAA